MVSLRTSTIIEIAFAATIIALAGCGPAQSPPNILLLSIDTLRADHLGCYGNDMWDRSPSPTLDRLASQGILFERCFAPRGQTVPSIASMLTGKYPISHSVRENHMLLSEKHITFIQRMKQNGYVTAGFASNLSMYLLPDKESSGPSWWARGLETFSDGYGGNLWQETKGADIEDQWSWDGRIEKQTLEWIDRHDPKKGKPFFLWAHFYDTHKPYMPHESCPDFYPDYEGPLVPPVIEKNGRQKDRVTAYINEATRTNRPLPEKDHKRVLAWYDASLYGIDQRIDRILKALEEKGMLDNTWIFFTSDHGDELGDHNNYYYHGASIYDSVLWIPLIVKGPGTPIGQRRDSLVQNVDIAPTLLELAGVKVPSDMEGLSLLNVLRENDESGKREHAVAEWQDQIYSYSDGRFKYICNPNGVCPVKPPYIKGGCFPYDFEELYDIIEDPLESRNILSGNEDVANGLKKKLWKWVGREGHERKMKREQANKEILELMKALGYTGGGFKKRKPEEGK